MNKAIIIILLILRIIITPFYCIAGGGTKTVELGEKAQVGLTGIYITVLEWRRVYPSVKEELPKKYIAFKVLLDATKERSQGDPPQHFGLPIGSNGNYSYDLCGSFYIEGKGDHKDKTIIGRLEGVKAHQLFGKNLQILGFGKLEDRTAEGWVIFELPEDFEIKKFVYIYHEHRDLMKVLLPKSENQLIFDNP